MQILKKATLAAATPIALSLIFTLIVPHMATARQASVVCAKLFAPTPEKHPRHNFVLANSYEQWLLWQELANKADMVQSTLSVRFETVRVPRADVDIWSADVPAAHEIAIQFVTDEWVRWPQHPFNKSSEVPFFNYTRDGTPLDVRLLASRSVAPIDNTSITVKMGTDHPHGVEREIQPIKARTDADIRLAIARTAHFAQVDRLLPADPILFPILDVFALIDKRSRNGVLFRNVSHLHDGNYHLPALSIPYVGRQIALANGAEFVTFWREHYAVALGRAKARLLLRYGLQMVTPNPQNISIQLDSDLKPIGRVEFSDISDTIFVEPVANALGFKLEIERDHKMGFGIDNDIFPYWANSHFLFDSAELHSIDRSTLAIWGHAHDMAYIAEIEQALGVAIVKNKSPRSSLWNYWFGSNRFFRVQRFLESPEGQRKIAEYAAGNRRAP